MDKNLDLKKSDEKVAKSNETLQALFDKAKKSVPIVTTANNAALDIYGICKGMSDDDAKKTRRKARKELYKLLTTSSSLGSLKVAFNDWCEKYKVDAKKGWHGTPKKQVHIDLLKSYEPVINSIIGK